MKHLTGTTLLLALACAGPQAGRHMVEIQGMSFHPESLSVASGDTVVWINRDIFPHTATAQGSSPWDSGELEQGDSAHYVVSQSGKLDYICRLHPTMRGALIVR